MLPKNTQGVHSDKVLATCVEGRSFGFSPIALQLRLGLATPSDLQTAVRNLSKLGFTQALGPKGSTSIRGLLTQISAAKDITRCLVVCPTTAPETMRATALRWSQGVVHDVDKPSGQIWVTRFIGEGSIGLDLNAPFVGDSRSHQGRCAQCMGSGRLQAYPWKLIVSDDRRAIADDNFWQPAVLTGIRSLRRSRMLPEAEFFARELVADFRQSPATMDSRTRFLFEHGVAWRRFLKPLASRTDREQDYYSWRGLHDYVYLSLSKISDVRHKQALKDGFREIPCPSCIGTGMSWETKCLHLDGKHIQTIWQTAKLREWRSHLDCENPALLVALKLELGELCANDHYGDLPKTVQERLLIALSYTASLDGLALVSASDTPLNHKLIKATGMKLVSYEERSGQMLP